MTVAKRIVRPQIRVQAVYLGNRDMREIFVSLLVDAARRENSSVRTFENAKDTQYNEDSNQIEEVV